MVETPEQALERAVRLAGGEAAVADLFGIRPQAVGQWKRCPAHRVLRLSAATQGQVTPHSLDPDLYPAEGVPAAAEPARLSA